MKPIGLIYQYIDLENKNVLDIGCHNGSFSKIFLDKGCTVLGIDIKNNIQTEILENKKFSFEEISIDSFKSEKKFDIVFARNVLSFSKIYLNENISKITNFVDEKGVLFFTYFGDEEIWGSEGRVKTVNRLYIDNLLKNFEDEFELKYFSEEKYEGSDMAKNIKFWHIFTVILKKK